MHANYSFKQYPRPDTEFKTKCSYDFDMARSNVYRMRPTGAKVQVFLWINCLIIGFVVGSIAFLMNIFIEALCNMKFT